MAISARLKESRAWVPRVKFSDDYATWFQKNIPAGYAFPKHIEYICREIAQKVIDGDLKRVIVSMPPQHGKSDTLTRRLPVYWQEKFPGSNVLLTGYNQTFANKRLSKPARDLAQERGILASDASAMDDWDTKNGGSVLARGVGNPPTGTGFGLVIIDDPIKSREEANSETIRENIWEWYTGSLVQRFWPQTRVIIIATRWHEDDLIGRLLAESEHEWHVINFAAEAEENDPLGREVGDPLWPEERPKEFLVSQRKAMGDYEYEALYQGNPTPREGALFKIAGIKPIDKQDIPKEAKQVSVMAFDVAASLDGDWSALCQIWGANGSFYLDIARTRLKTDDRNKWMKEQVKARDPGLVLTPIDPGSAGKDVGHFFIQMLAGWAVEANRVTGSKETRAEPLASQVNAGNVYLVNSPDSAAFIEELRQFPGGKNDDMVDAASDAFTAIARRSELSVSSRVETKRDEPWDEDWDMPKAWLKNG